MQLVLALAIAGGLGGCASSSRSMSGAGFSESATGVKTSPRVAVSTSGPIPKGGGVYKLGSPYKVSGQWFVPQDDPGYDRVGTASWYGEDFHARRTANGEIYDMNALTAAHPTLPLPSYVYVTNLANNRTVLVRVNDRGPYVAGRLIDLSRASAAALGLHQKGTGRVRVRYAGPAPLDGNELRERRFLAGQPWNGAYQPRVASAADARALPWSSPADAASWSASTYRMGLATDR